MEAQGQQASLLVGRARVGIFVLLAALLLASVLGVSRFSGLAEEAGELAGQGHGGTGGAGGAGNGGGGAGNGGGGTGGGGPEWVTIPDVREKTVVDAAADLSRVGLVVGQPKTEFSETVPSGHVIDTEPPIGQQVTKGHHVILFVSGGAEGVIVPDVVALLEPEARTRLEASEFTVVVASEFSNTVDIGLVIRQEPPAMSHAAKGSGVTIVLSQGPKIHTITLLGRAGFEPLSLDMGSQDTLEVKNNTAVREVKCWIHDPQVNQRITDNFPVRNDSGFSETLDTLGIEARAEPYELVCVYGGAPDHAEARAELVVTP